MKTRKTFRALFLTAFIFILGMSTKGLLAHKQVMVGPEDTIYGIAYQEGVPTRVLISANGLRPPYALTAGQILVIPAPNEHIAAGGETLQDIASSRGVNVDVLAQENNLQPGYVVKQGDTFVVPARDTRSIAQTLPPVPVEIKTTSLDPLPLGHPAPPQARFESNPPASFPQRGGENTPSSASPSPTLPADIAEELAREHHRHEGDKPALVGNLAHKNEGAPLGEPSYEKKEKKELKKEIREEVKKEEKEKKDKKEKKKETPKEVGFGWPVQGEVIEPFAAGKCEGINIQVAEGTPVKAAAAGEVIYVGNEIKNLGNLVLLKHPNGYVTAYAYLSEAKVTKGAKVKKGAIIAKSGNSGEATAPQLHFEIREGKKPVNPLKKLK